MSHRATVVSEDPVASKNSLNGLNARQLMFAECACRRVCVLRDASGARGQVDEMRGTSPKQHTGPPAYGTKEVKRQDRRAKQHTGPGTRYAGQECKATHGIRYRRKARQEGRAAHEDGKQGSKGRVRGGRGDRGRACEKHALAQRRGFARTLRRLLL